MKRLKAIFACTALLFCAWLSFTPVDETIRDDPKVEHAMSAYRAGHPACEWCGTDKDCQVHHIQPLWLNPSVAGDTNNMIMLCRQDHLRLGHAGDFGKRAVTNIREVCAMRVIVERKKE